MNQAIRGWMIAALSFVFTYLFFIDYLAPLRRVHIPYDLEGFHHPLADYAFQAIRHGRFPEWDPTIYCGLSFAGNIQAALFYPPTWLLFTWVVFAVCAVTPVLFSVAIFILPAERGALRAALGTALLLTVRVDYKVFGTGNCGTTTNIVSPWMSQLPFHWSSGTTNSERRKVSILC
jgi:hypothetical protein